MQVSVTMGRPACFNVPDDELAGISISHFPSFERREVMPSPRKKAELRIVPEQDKKVDDSMQSYLIERIAERAYSLYERRGRKDGSDLEDWLRAEREILLESTIH